ncbi:MAG: hypothetical protein P8M78_08545 [Myxococcota bacterium]|nr:hypothetical protein [Myxococcota bacterium]
MYTDRQLKRFRQVALGLWIFGFLSFLPPLAETGFGSLGRPLFGILFCAHLIEFPIFWKVYQAADGSMFGHFLRHMAYGILYKTEVEQRNPAS